MAGIKSVEEKVEDIAKEELKKYRLKYYAKTDGINAEIDNALKNSPSKSGGSGGNYPDIRLLLKTETNKTYPIMIEVKGARDKLEKLNAQGEVENLTAKDEPNYSNINGFAVNGAIHYANAIIKYAESYEDIIAIGINGYEEADNTLKTETGVYYVSADNLGVPKKVAEFHDLSFLAPSNFDAFIKKVERLKLSPEELEAQSRKIEEQIETSLKSLNQSMHDDLKISVGSRVELIVGMIMAGLGVKNKVAPLEITDLKGDIGQNTNDGKIIMNKISDFLTERELPQEKKDMIINDLSRVFVYSGLYNSRKLGKQTQNGLYESQKRNIADIQIVAPS